VGYKVLGFSGPPHNREFEIEAVVDGAALGRGFGTSKKRAEQEAAAEALHELQSRARRTARRARLRGSRSRRTPSEDEAGPGEAPEAGPAPDTASDESGAARASSSGATEVS
jgi:hypothetical protein